MGGGLSGSANVRDHAFLKTVDWLAVERKEGPVPFPIVVGSDLPMAAAVVSTASKDLPVISRNSASAHVKERRRSHAQTAHM